MKQEMTIFSLEEFNEFATPEVVEQMGGVGRTNDFAILLDIDTSEPYRDGKTDYPAVISWTKTAIVTQYYGDVAIVFDPESVWKNKMDACHKSTGIRPILKVDNISNLPLKEVNSSGPLSEVEYGEYPQVVADDNISKVLEQELLAGTLRKTGKSYTIDATCGTWNSSKYSFQPKELEEYEFNGKKYVRLKARDTSFEQCRLSNGKVVGENDEIWIEVKPIVWLVKDNETLVCKTCLTTGVRMCEHLKYKGNYDESEVAMFLNTYLIKEIVPSKTHEMSEEEILECQTKLEQSKNQKNPYELTFEKVSEEQILKDAIEAGVPVFLHGPSSEGKSARVKAIDPDLTIVYLRNASPESLNGKSVFDSATNEMIDVKPSWLVKLEKKCKEEPDKIHVVFFDEISNALPSIQGIAFNIVLDKEVNGKWQLPENARIVAAGNEMKDSLSANPIAAPLFNRFAHVYIHTTTEGWLEWASKNNIHPAIYSYIAFRNGEPLRSKYDGIHPNADPRKWEMASKLLYATGKPAMLRALVGEDITKEFMEFCRQQVITLKDVLLGNYNLDVINTLNTAARYATVSGLTQVNEENLETVRNFVSNLGAEFVAIFDQLWIRGDEARQQIIESIKQNDKKGGGMRR